MELVEETIEQLDRDRIEDESSDELINELVTIYQTTEITLDPGSDSL